jgi:hypothetical protein
MGKSVDFIRMICFMMGNSVKFFNVWSTGLINQILDTLIELVQGPCKGNQRNLISSKVIDFSRDLISSYNIEFGARGFAIENEDS